MNARRAFTPLRAAWRLARVALHVLRGLAIVTLVFPALDTPAREARIGRWARRLFSVLGVRIDARGATGELGARGGLIVANHVSWLDILAVHALAPRTRFVGMAELQQWIGVAPLVAAARTIYLQRHSPRDVLRVVQAVRRALEAGDAVAVFPEGIVGDGRTLGPFHGNLLQAAIDSGAMVSPLALRYGDAAGACSDAALFTGDITLWQSIWRLAAAEPLVLRLHALPALRAEPGACRRALAQGLRSRIEDALAAAPTVAPAITPAVASPAPNIGARCPHALPPHPPTRLPWGSTSSSSVPARPAAHSRSA